MKTQTLRDLMNLIWPVDENDVAGLGGEAGDRRDVILILRFRSWDAPGRFAGSFGELKRFLPPVGDRFSRTAAFLGSQPSLGVVFERADELC